VIYDLENTLEMRVTTDDGLSLDKDIKKLRGLSQAVNQKAIDKLSKSIDKVANKEELRKNTLP